jgi:signal transduction histidine kinase
MNAPVRHPEHHRAGQPPRGRAEPSGGSHNAAADAGKKPLLRRRSVRSRVALLVLIPLFGALLLGASVFSGAVNEATTAGAVERNARTVQSVTAVVARLQDERDVMALANAGASTEDEVAERRQQTDDAIVALDARLDELTVDEDSPIGQATSAARAELAGLDGYREANIDRYRLMIQTLHTFIKASGTGLTDPELVDQVDALESLARTTEAASVERGLVAHLLILGGEVSDARNRIASVSRTEQDLLLEPYAVAADATDWTTYSESRKVVEELRRDVLAGRSVDHQEWYVASTDRIELLRSLQSSTADSIVAEASSAATRAQLLAGVTAALVLAVLVLTVTVAYAVARSIVQPLRRLRGAVLEAADTGLPALVARIQSDGPSVVHEIGDVVEPDGSDEIAQVASAFNLVHATAVRVAGEQALLRQNLDTIVVNLSRRTQGLVDRQLGEIEDLESRERDPDQLGTLFRIDHLATRVRRHAESLLVLAGVEEMRRQGVAAPVLDVVRTAVGEVEQYPRIKFGVMPTDLIVSSAVDDVAHLLAELIDNATEFSAPSTAVHVSIQPLLGGGLRIEVTDSGLGIPAGQLNALNARLREPGDIDVAASRTLGLYVVSRLAARHGIIVRLVPAAEGASGIIAQVDLPGHLTVSPLDAPAGALPPAQPSTPPSTGRTESLLERGQTDTEFAHPQEQPAPMPVTAGSAPSQPAYSEPRQPGPQPAPPGSPSPQPAPQQPALPQLTPPQPVLAAATAGLVANTPDPIPQATRRPRRAAAELPPGDSPIFDAVRSAWFQRGNAVDWASPGDDGWRRAAAALRTAEDAADTRRGISMTRSAQAQPPWSGGGAPGPLAGGGSRGKLAGGSMGQRHVPSAGPPASKAPPTPAAPTAPAQPAHASGPTGQGNNPDLPLRERGATLVPGSIPGAEQAVVGSRPNRDQAGATNVASTLSNLQRGVNRGRAETGGWVPKRPKDS